MRYNAVLPQLLATKQALKQFTACAGIPSEVAIYSSRSSTDGGHVTHGGSSSSSSTDAAVFERLLNDNSVSFYGAAGLVMTRQPQKLKRWRS